MFNTRKKLVQHLLDVHKMHVQGLDNMTKTHLKKVHKIIHSYNKGR